MYFLGIINWKIDTNNLQFSCRNRPSHREVYRWICDTRTPKSNMSKSHPLGYRLHCTLQQWRVNFLGMLSATRSENAYVPLIAINCPDASEFSNAPSDSYLTRRWATKLCDVIARQDGKRLHCKYLRMSHTKPLSHTKALYGTMGGTYSASVFRPVVGSICKAMN